MGNPETFVDSTTVAGAVAVGSTGNVALISSAAGAIYVYAYSLAAPSTIANNGLTVRLMSGSTVECWRLMGSRWRRRPISSAPKPARR